MLAHDHVMEAFPMLEERTERVRTARAKRADEGPQGLGRGAVTRYRAPDPIARLKRVAARRGQHAAIVAGERTVSYAELARSVGQLGARLRRLGVGEGKRVAMYLSRGVDAPMVMLATWAAGGGYVPLDPTHPEARIRMILEDARPEVLVTERALLAGLDVPAGIPVLVLDEEREALARERPIALEAPRNAEALAYVLFTSGSTGRPKGVAVPRRAIANFLRSMAHTPGMSEHDRLLSVTTVTFDIAALELFLPLWVGATVVIAGRDDVVDPERLRALLVAHQITVFQATPVTYRLLLEAGLGSEARGMRMLCGGEAMSRELARKLTDLGAELWNMYGPTETTVWSTLARVRGDSVPISIGKAIDETQVYVLDDKLGVVAPGEIGELCIGGRGVALGYFERDDLTSARFVQNPHGPAGDRIYRTGDLARFLPNGDLECLGRIDHQVKIRGFRIELGEVESAIRAVPGVRDAVVTAVGERDVTLAAYVIGEARHDAIRAHVVSALPDYMRPTLYTTLDAFPLNTNGKVDRKALPAPAPAPVTAREEAEPSFGSDEEATVAELVREVLDCGDVPRDRDLFALGATSLKLVQLRARMRDRLGVDVPLAVLFDAPTVRQLALRLGRSAQPSAPSFVRLARGDDDVPPLLCLMGIALYRDLAQRVGDGRNVYGVHVPFQPRDGEVPRVKDLAKMYVDAILDHVPRGPYHLAGLCFGGMLAFEVAHQLRERGREVGSVTLFDAPLPRAEHYSPLTHARALVTGAFTSPLATFGRVRARFASKAPTASSELANDGEFDVDGPLARAMVAAYDREVVPLDAPVLVCRASGQKEVAWRRTDVHQGWLGLSPRLVVESVPGDHLGMLEDPNAEVTAAAVRRMLSLPMPRDGRRRSRTSVVARQVEAGRISQVP